ncbi:MAG: transcriptional repressor LexA [Aureliella sp.]
MKRPLTKQQQAVYNMIRERIIGRGYGPTVREIGEHMNIKSPNGVMCHLRALERKGMILRASNKSRAIELTESIASLVGATLKIEGNIAGGVCTVLGENYQQVDLADLTAQGSSFLRVGDESLIEAQIRNGDLVVLHQQTQAVAGQLTMVRTAELGTCIRYWYPDQDQIRLQPVSCTEAASTVAQAEVLGIIVGVVRMIQPPLPELESQP